MRGLRKLPGFPGYYASPRGEIWRGDLDGTFVRVKDSLDSTKRGGRYWRVKLRDPSGKWLSRYVHVLICIAFHGAPPLGKPEVCHGDGDKGNNRPGNLRWGDRADQQRDKRRQGTHTRRRLPPGSSQADLFP